MPGPVPRRFVVIRALLVLAVAAFAASVLLRSPPRFDPWLDAGVYNLAFVLAATACWLRAAADPVDRTAWRLIASGIVLFTMANVYGSLVVGDQDIYPSPADAMWLSFYGLIYVAIVLMVRRRIHHFLPSLWLDGAVAGFGAAALVVAFALGPVLAETQGEFQVVATNLAYPTVEIFLIILLVSAGTAVRARDASWWLLAIGLAAFASGDITYLFEESAGSYQEGGLLDVVWPVAVACIGWAATTRGDPAPSDVPITGQIAIPAVFGATSLGLLVYGQDQDLPPVAVGLAAAALVIALVRTLLTIGEVQALANSRREARTDELTGLANRRQLVERLTEAVERPGPGGALVILDLDRFKEINDSLGHAAGDRILRAVTRRLSPVVTGDMLLGRLGGDEFAVVAPGASPEAGAELAERLRRSLSDLFEVAGRTIPLDASFGVAAAPSHGTTAGELMSHADIAMYRAKRQRTGVEIFDPARDIASPERLALLGELRAALAEGQFHVHYQPQLDLETGTVVSIEALVRWEHPARGFLAPDEFLPAAEQANLMPRLTSYVLDRALGDCARLRRSGFPVAVAVNVSPADLIDGRLPERIEERLAAHAMPSGALLVEVTESTILADRVRGLKVLRRLRDAGVAISVDDYGTGQASLSYLRDLPLSAIKLDRSFIDGVPEDGRNAAIVRSTVELAHAFGLPIVAEGIEDAAALEWLRELGCDLGQGFHIARPLPFPELVRWLDRWPAPDGEADGAPPPLGRIPRRPSVLPTLRRG